MRANLKDIAAATGMAASSISRILRNDPRAAEFRAETRDMVTRVAREMGYVRNLSAATIRNGFNNSTIAILLDEQDKYMQSSVFVLIQALNQRNCGARVYCSNDLEGVFREILSNQIRWIINFKKGKDDLTECADFCRNHGLKMVIHRRDLLFKDFPSMGSDDASMMREMVHYLFEHKHKNIALISGPLDDPLRRANQFRLRGWISGLNDCGLSACKKNVADMASFSARKLAGLLRNARPTALCVVEPYFCFNVELALRAFGLRVPEDISLVTFGNPSLFQRFMRVPVTAVRELEFSDRLEFILQYFYAKDQKPDDGTHYSSFVKGILAEGKSVSSPNPESRIHLFAKQPLNKILHEDLYTQQIADISTSDCEEQAK